MPRKTKETNEIIKQAKSSNTADVSKKESPKTTVKNTKSVAKKSTAKKDTTSKSKPATKKTSTTKSVAKKTSATSKTVANKKTTTKKTTSKTTATKTASKKSTTTKKKADTKSTTKKVLTKKSTAKKQKVDIVEYYDLPYRYNQTVVKVLAQTPNNLFIYWDISDADRENYKKQYGENFFETTKPVLIIHNTTLNYSFEIDINDFANSWYLHVNDSKCDYKIELGRRPIAENPRINTDYIYISTSNEIESPNDHVLFNKKQKTVCFRNTKTGVQIEKPISTNLSFIKSMSNIYDNYDIEEFYKVLYKNEDIEKFYDLSNPSSGNPSSGSLSSKFK